jgi:hypothetical protein
LSLSISFRDECCVERLELVDEIVQSSIRCNQGTERVGLFGGNRRRHLTSI